MELFDFFDGCLFGGPGEIPMWRFLLPVGLVFLLSACSHPLPPDRRQYEGEWHNPVMDVVIRPDGSVSYTRRHENHTTSINAPLKEFDGNDFVVGVAFFTTRFHVTTPPYVVNGQWRMVVDGQELVRVRSFPQPGQTDSGGAQI